MSKKICKLIKDDILEKNFDEYIEVVKKAKYVCKKCGHVSNDESKLCKPIKMKSEKKDK